MAFSKKLEFGNYTLRFGSEKVLLDLFNEVVKPSFEELRYIRRIKNKADFFFLDTKLVLLDSNESYPAIGVTGKIVKNTRLRREQIYRRGTGLVANEGELESAPSSTFLLILNNHRLVFFRDMPDAPTIKNFEGTSKYCLAKRYKEYIEEQKEAQVIEYEEGRRQDRPTKAGLREKTPAPKLRITPLADPQNLRDFVNRFHEINAVSIKLLPTNEDELDNDDFWASLEENRKSMGPSSRAKVEYTSAKDGLDSEEVYEEVNAASQYANSEIRFRGADSLGDDIKGNNDDFSLSIEVEDFPRNPSRAAQPAYNAFKRLVELGQISVPRTTEKVRRVIRALLPETD